jgi:hypothetical protein
MARAATLLALLAAGANAQQDSGQFPQASGQWSLLFRHQGSVNGDAVYCECAHDHDQDVTPPSHRMHAPRF